VDGILDAAFEQSGLVQCPARREREELIAEVGKPTARQRAAATAVVKKLTARPRRKAG